MNEKMAKDKYYGKTLRKNFARHEEVMPMPNLLAIQKKSYKEFLDSGLREVFTDVGAITDYQGNLELSFIDYKMDEAPKYDVEECKARDATYAAPLKVKVRLRNKETEEIKEQEIFMGDFPLMTHSGTFVINGAERVVVSQIVRSPGVYYGKEIDIKTDLPILTSTVIPYRGAWLEYETDANEVFWVRIDKNRKLPITCLIRALGLKTDAEILELFGDDPRIAVTLEKDPCKTYEDAMLEIYRKLRPGEPPTVEGSIDYERRFDLMQQHTGEHIVSGIIHRRYGYHNVGFHMGADLIQIDFDGLVPVEDLPVIEQEANKALWQNLPVRCWYPSQEELPNVFYRTKRALPWPVRIVQVPGYDSCACCGVHVAMTGEVGLVKLFSVVGLRGGCRVEMACGKRALALLNTAFEQNRQVSQAFSAKWPETGEAARRMNETLAAEKYRAAQLQRHIFGSIAKCYVNCGDVIHFEPGLESVEIRQLADAIAAGCGGMAAVFSGADGEGYGFAMVIRDGDLRPLGKAMTQALSGRGGGKPNFQQGRVATPRTEIEAFFAQH